MTLAALLINILDLTILKSREFLFLIEKILSINVFEKKVIESNNENITPILNEIKEEKTTFELYLLEKIVDQSNKIKAIKTVRDITGLELRLAKDLIDKAPITIKKDLTKEEAENLLKKCEGINAKFEIR